MRDALRLETNRVWGFKPGRDLEARADGDASACLVPLRSECLWAVEGLVGVFGFFCFTFFVVFGASPVCLASFSGDGGRVSGLRKSPEDRWRCRFRRAIRSRDWLASADWSLVLLRVCIRLECFDGFA